MRRPLRFRAFPLFVGLSVVGGLAPAHAQSLVAITGARIVDGSGNEPFTGTIVIEGGRIRAVGRSVEVPAGAVTIDGSGRTVLPGLIDVRMRPDASAHRGGTKSALAASLYSGVTTAFIAGIPVDRFDTLRADAGAVDGGPRVLIAGTLAPAVAGGAGAAAEWARVLRAGVHAISLSADVPGAGALASDARSRGVRIVAELQSGSTIDAALALEPTLVVGPMVAPLTGAADLPPRNVTAAPDLLSAGRAVPAGKLAADLSGPVAAGPMTGGDGGAGWSARVEGLRALREARVRLAAASDGDPALPAGWAMHAALRLLVDAGASPLEAVTAAAGGGSWALGLQSDRGFLAPGMRADLIVVQGDPTTSITDLERIDRIFLGGAEVDRAALLARIHTLDAPPAPTASASTPPAGPSPAPVPPAGTRRRGRDRKSDPAATTATVPPTPPPAEAAPAGAAATPATGRTTSEPAPAAPAPAEPASIEDPLVDDFERADDRSSFGPPWSSGSSEATTPATIVMGRVVRGLRDHALHLTARMGSGPAPFVRASIPLSVDGRPVDVSRFRGLRFDARGEGRYRVIFVTRSVTDGRYHESYFSGSPNWTPVGIPFASVGQNGRGGHAPFVGRDLVEIRFEIARDPGQMAWLELDNVRFY